MMLILLAQLLVGQTSLSAATPATELRDRPFASGEVLVYDARVSIFGRVGGATLGVTDACSIGGHAALLLSFDVSGGAGFMRVEDETRSWIDAESLATLRYEKRESSPLGSHHESVTVLADDQRWQDATGRSFPLASNLAIDELSLLYFVRSLPLRTGDTSLDAGHFDLRRNPIALRVLGRTVVDVPAGRFNVIDVELRVRDPRRYRGTGVIRLLLTDDARRVPVRIRTALPGSAAVTLELRGTGTSTDDAPAASCT